MKEVDVLIAEDTEIAYKMLLRLVTHMRNRAREVDDFCNHLEACNDDPRVLEDYQDYSDDCNNTADVFQHVMTSLGVDSDELKSMEVDYGVH